jgi:deoxyribose-phosphate aldolase
MASWTYKVEREGIVKTTLDLDRLVQQITEEIIAELGKVPCSTQVVCKGCVGCLGNSHCAAQCTPDVEHLVNLGAARIGAGPGIGKLPTTLASIIDHTLLKPDALPRDIEKVCQEAIQYGFASVCVHPSYTPLVAELLAGTPVKTCTVIGFPLGATKTEVKAYEARLAEQDGAREVDMVIHIGAIKSGGYQYVENDIGEVVRAVSQGTLVKVILETALLTDEEKMKACELAQQAGAHFVKTSTGFGPGGATAADVALMRRIVGPSMGVKASGGVRTREDAVTMVRAGASRIGASASVQIVAK